MIDTHGMLYMYVYILYVHTYIYVIYIYEYVYTYIYIYIYNKYIYTEKKSTGNFISIENQSTLKLLNEASPICKR